MDHYMGQIITVAFDFAPPNWLPCDGRSMPINTYAALFTLLGTRFGGDGIRTFNLPRYPEVPPAANDTKRLYYLIAISGIFPQPQS